MHIAFVFFAMLLLCVVIGRRGRSLAIGFSAMSVLAFVCLPANAQEIVHGRAGEIVAANAAAKTLTLKVADGSMIVFNDVADPEPPMSFDKTVRSKTVPVATFHQVGAHVVVFYFGYGNLTAVAVKDIGTDAPQKSSGSVANFDRHQHLLTLKTETAEPQKMLLSGDTIVDTPEGIVKSADFHPDKGARLRWFAKPESKTALFVAPN